MCMQYLPYFLSYYVFSIIFYLLKELLAKHAIESRALKGECNSKWPTLTLHLGLLTLEQSLGYWEKTQTAWCAQLLALPALLDIVEKLVSQMWLKLPYYVLSKD